MNFVQPIRDPAMIEEFKRYLRKKSYRDCFLFEMGINTGLRISDLLPLKVKDVRGKTHVILRSKKTGTQVSFPLYNLQQEIKEYIQGKNDEDYLFPSRNQQGSKPLGRIQAYKMLSDAGKKLGLGEIGTHTLRKTFGYHFYKLKKDVAMLQKIFGHSAPSITLRYIGIARDEIDLELQDFKI